MIQLASDAAYILQFACEEALNEEHKYVETIHFVWSCFHTYIPQSILTYLEQDRMVYVQGVREYFQSSSEWKELCVPYEGGNRSSKTIKIAPELEKAISEAGEQAENVPDAIDIINVFLRDTGKNIVKDILASTAVRQEGVLAVRRLSSDDVFESWDTFSRFSSGSFKFLLNEESSFSRASDLKSFNFTDANHVNHQKESIHQKESSNQHKELKSSFRRLPSKRKQISYAKQIVEKENKLKPTLSRRSSKNETLLLLESTNFKLLDSLRCVVVSKSDVKPLARSNSAFFRENSRFFQDLTQPKGNIQCSNEITLSGKLWRSVMRKIVLARNDCTNATRITRGLQLFLPFLTGYEAYVLDQVIDAFGKVDDKKQLKYVLSVALKNRNVSRIVLQNLDRFDILWHNSTRMQSNKILDFVGNFPTTENAPASSDNASNSVFRKLLGEGRWWTRLVTGREGLAVDDKNIPAQNLAAESNGFETANRAQHGTHFGRERTNQFRNEHRLPVDESIVRTFIASPGPTITNNGVEHVITTVANHWENMLDQDSGNFAHQRMEQLDPFEILRFHMPEVLTKLITLRGLNDWDQKVLAPYVRKLEGIHPSHDLDPIRDLVVEFNESILANVCGGIDSRMKPLRRWMDAIRQALDDIEQEAQEVFTLLSSVEVGIRLGHDLVTQVDWSVPSQKILAQHLDRYILGQHSTNKTSTVVPEHLISRALAILAPKDKRTLIELCTKQHGKTKAAKLIRARAIQVLKREIQRFNLENTIEMISLGDPVDEYEANQAYWVHSGDLKRICTYVEIKQGTEEYHFIDRSTEAVVLNPESTVTEFQVFTYVPVAESISRAQKAFMYFELDHGKTFTTNAFMEFSFLRVYLRKLIVLGQTHCVSLDNARMDILKATQDSQNVNIAAKDLEVGKSYFVYANGQYEPFIYERKLDRNDPEWSFFRNKRIVTMPPQSMIVIGGGPTGLLTALHALEYVLISGGEMKLLEARDAFAKGGSTFERAQIVRLDARWIAMLRYHLGTGFEDVYIPLSGESVAHIGSTLPTQGFVEITIKDLENMLQLAIAKMLSRRLLVHDTQSGAGYNVTENALKKQGKALKVGDQISMKKNHEGNDTDAEFPWQVEHVVYNEPLTSKGLQVGEYYEIYEHTLKKLCTFQLVAHDIRKDALCFESQDSEAYSDIDTTTGSLPTVYPKGTKSHSEVLKVIVRCMLRSRNSKFTKLELDFSEISGQQFSLNIGNTHVVEAIGKPHGSKVHFRVTCEEPYGVCCIGGAKVSMGMHRFGNPRWGHGFIDDIRATKDQNTRIVGDFTKNVKVSSIADSMYTAIMSEEWRLHFEGLLQDCEFEELLNAEPVIPKLRLAVKMYKENSPGFYRNYLQTRSFETGDNSYLGMEFPREYSTWLADTLSDVVAPAMMVVKGKGEKALLRWKGMLSHHIDRLFFHGALDVLRTADVYNPGAREKIPRFYMIDSKISTKLSKLSAGETFAVVDEPKRFEVLKKGLFGRIIARDVEGHVRTFHRHTRVCRGGNLTRGPDGEVESKVALATFPVAHYVNVRTMRVNNLKKGYVFAFIGDEQSTPHFMRYSGLTGAAINAMEVNNFIRGAIQRHTFIERYRTYSKETNWSNSEVVTRGIGAGYGDDGFLRPGFSYNDVVSYLYEKVIEYTETIQDRNTMLSVEWKTKLASGLIPRGLESSESYVQTVVKKCKAKIVEVVYKHLMEDPLLVDVVQAQSEKCTLQGGSCSFEETLQSLKHDLNHGSFESEISERLREHIEIATWLDVLILQLVDHAKMGYKEETRISTQATIQPKSVDSITDDFAVEAQNFANGLSNGAAFAAGAVAARTFTDSASAVLSAFTPFIAFGTLTNASRYKNRNEEARIVYYEIYLLELQKSIFQYMSLADQQAVGKDDNPYLQSFSKAYEIFENAVKYYNCKESIELKQQVDDILLEPMNEKFVNNLQNDICSTYIPEVYHDQPYLKDMLVSLYAILETMIHPMTESGSGSTQSSAKILFDQLNNFRRDLNISLERRSIKFGWHKPRKLRHSHIGAVGTYLWHQVIRLKGHRKAFTGSSIWKPMSIATEQILYQVKLLATDLKELGLVAALSREIYQLEHLRFATKENYKTSLVIGSAWISGITGIAFTTGRIIGVSGVSSVAAWTFGILGPIPAVLSVHMLSKKTALIRTLQKALKVKLATAIQSGENAEAVSLRRVLKLLRQVKWVTATRICASGLAGAALPLGLATANSVVPLALAGGAIALAVASTIANISIEYNVRHKFESQLGEYICEAFREEIMLLHSKFSREQTTLKTVQSQERDAWEYTAREFLHQYRFDVIFGGDRLGSILQYIQSGLYNEKVNHSTTENQFSTDRSLQVIQAA